MPENTRSSELEALLLEFLREFEDKKQNAFRLLEQGKIPRPARAVEQEHIKIYHQRIEALIASKVEEARIDEREHTFKLVNDIRYQNISLDFAKELSNERLSEAQAKRYLKALQSKEREK